MIMENNNTTDNTRLANFLLRTIRKQDNIINELEEYICTIEYDERHSDSWQIPVRIHNKLKELKGSDKE